MICSYRTGFLFFKWSCQEPAVGLCMKCLQPMCAGHRSRAAAPGQSICVRCSPSDHDSDDDHSTGGSSDSGSSSSSYGSGSDGGSSGDWSDSSPGGSDSGSSDSGSSSSSSD